MAEAAVRDVSHCEACGEYIPLTLAGDPTPHDCGRTPPLGGLPPTIFACPTCHGHAPYAAGCWGSRTHPHEHNFMRPVHELLAGEHLAERLEGTEPLTDEELGALGAALHAGVVEGQITEEQHDRLLDWAKLRARLAKEDG